MTLASSQLAYAFEQVTGFLEAPPVGLATEGALVDLETVSYGVSGPRAPVEILIDRRGSHVYASSPTTPFSPRVSTPHATACGR